MLTDLRCYKLLSIRIIVSADLDDKLACILDQIEVVSVLAIDITDDILYLRASAQQIVDVVLDCLECLDSVIAAGSLVRQICHIGRTERIVLLSGFARIQNRIAVIFRSSLHVCLIGQVERFVDTHCMIRALTVKNSLCADGILVIIQCFVCIAVGEDLLADGVQVLRPVFRNILAGIRCFRTILDIPAVRTCKDTLSVLFGLGVSVLTADRGRVTGRRVAVTVIHVGDAVADKDEILSAVQRVALLQHVDAREQTGMRVRAALDLLLDCSDDFVILGGQIHVLACVCFLVEDHDADVDLGIVSLNLALQCLQHRQCLILDVRTRGLVQNEDDVGYQLFICRRQRQGYLGLKVLIQLGCRLGLGNFPILEQRLGGLRLFLLRLLFRNGFRRFLCRRIDSWCFGFVLNGLFRRSFRRLFVRFLGFRLFRRFLSHGLVCRSFCRFTDNSCRKIFVGDDRSRLSRLRSRRLDNDRLFRRCFFVSRKRGHRKHRAGKCHRNNRRQKSFAYVLHTAPPYSICIRTAGDSLRRADHKALNQRQ